MIGGAFWLVNSTKAVDEGIMKFISKVRRLERFSFIRRLGVGNIVITLVMLLFGLFGAVFGMSEETIAFVAVVIPAVVLRNRVPSLLLGCPHVDCHFVCIVVCFEDKKTG